MLMQLSPLPYGDIQESQVIASVACLPAYTPQDIRDWLLEDSLVGPLLKAKEAD